MVNKILIIGYGSIGKRHHEVLKKILPKAKIGILRHQKEKKLVKIKGVEKVFFDLESALAFNPELAVLSNPSSLHAEYAVHFLKKNIHLFIEKPLTSNLKDSLKIAKGYQNSKSKVMIGYNLRFYDSLKEFKRLIDINFCGEVFSFRCEVGSYLPFWRENSDYKKGVSAKKSLGGGVLLELSHEIDYLNWIFGKARWVNTFLDKSSLLNVDVEDNAYIIASFKNKKKEIKGVLNMDFYRRDPTRTCTIIGEKTSLRWDGLRGTIETYDKFLNKWVKIFSKKNEKEMSYFKEWESFLKCIKHDGKENISIPESIEVLSLVEACKNSSKKEKKIYLK